MVERPIQTGNIGVSGQQIEQWFGIGRPETSRHLLFELKPRSEDRLSESLWKLSHSKGIDTVGGRRALKDVLQCFEQNNDIRLPPNTHTGGNTLYGQVAAAYDAYRNGALTPEAMNTVELFTENLLLSVAGTTKDISADTYLHELQTGTVSTTAIRETTDPLGQRALDALDHINKLFVQHKKSIIASQPDNALNPVWKPAYAIPAKAAGALVAMELILTGCVSNTQPTISPTEVTKPAITAPLPTERPTQSPTQAPTLIPTEIKTTPTAEAKPNASADYPSSITDRVLSDSVLQAQKTAYAELVKGNNDVASEARTMESRLKLIGGSTISTEGVVDHARWGIIAKNSDGTPMVLQKTTDGGKTWLNVSDASAYTELVSNSKFDKANYKLIPLQRPAGIPADATGEVITQNNWMVYVWRDKTSGKILAWYDAAHDQFLGIDGKKLELAKLFKPFEVGLTLQSYQQNTVTWPENDNNTSQNELHSMSQLDQKNLTAGQGKDIDLFYITSRDSAMPYVIMADGTTSSDWLITEFNTAKINPDITIATVGKLKNPLNHDMTLFRIPVGLQTADKKIVTSYITVVIDSQQQQKFFRDVYPNNLDKANKNIKQLGASNLISILNGNWRRYSGAFIMPAKKFELGNMPDEYQMLAQLANYNLDHDAYETLTKILNGQGTEEDIENISQNFIFPMFRLYFDPVD